MSPASSIELHDLVRCPACHEPLRSVGVERLECDACAADYPVYDGIPWLFRDVPGSRAQWAAKLQRFRNELLAERATLETSLAEEDLLPSTRDRLERQKAGLERQGEQIFALLEPFAFAHSEAGGALPRDRIPTAQHVTSYLETAFRDWCWGEDEIRQSLAFVLPLVSGVTAGGGTPSGGPKILVLGGGAGRLAFELARALPTAAVVQLDLNPLLTRIGRCVSLGESVLLTERPRFPRTLDSVAVDQQLARPEAPAAERALRFLLGDLFCPPFAPGGFDLVVAPWLVDILPEPFRDVARRLGALLAPGGRLVGFGPLSFEPMAPEDRLTPDEMCEALGEAGFEVESTSLERVDYLHSPHDMARRGEEVFVFAAIHRAKHAAPDAFSFYPEWLLDGSRPIPALELFETLRGERTFDVEILKSIDGRASIEDIVIILASRYGLEPDRCRNTINRFFSRLIEGDAGDAR